MQRRRTTLALAAIASAFTVGGCTALDGGDGGSGGKADSFDGDPALLQCPDREPEVRVAIQQLLFELKNGSRPEVTSVDALLAALPPEVRENIIFFTDTRSMAKVYPLLEKRRMTFSSTRSSDFSFHQDGDRWCSTSVGGTSCIESRVLFTSREADFIGSFTTHPDSPAKNHFELMLFDASTSDLELVDIEFKAGEAIVTENPETCLLCHEGRDRSLNWRFDPYRFWAYATPFSEDFLRGDSIEKDWYKSFLARIAGGEPGLGQLRPVNTSAEIDSGTAGRDGYLLEAVPAAVNFSGNNSPALNLSHQLLEKNACRSAVSVAQRDDFSDVKYAAVGGLIGCENVDDFFPTEGSYTRATAESYFVFQREGVDASGAFDLELFTTQLKARQAQLASDKLSKRFDHFVEFVGAERAMEELRGAIGGGPVQPGYGVTNFERDDNGTAIARTRFLLEPLGIDVSQWTMAVDRVHQSHVEFLHPFAVQPVFLDFLMREFRAEIGQDLAGDTCQNLGQGGNASGCYATLQAARPQLCPRLAERSRAALRDHPGEEPEFDELATYRVEDPTRLENRARNLAASSSLDQLEVRVKPIYEMCATCHEHAYEFGMPWLPYNDLDELAALFRRGRDAAIHEMDGQTVGVNNGGGRPHTFRYIGLADRIWDRINRHPRQHSFMPRTKIPLTTDEKVAVRAHMMKVLGQPAGSP